VQSFGETALTDKLTRFYKKLETLVLAPVSAARSNMGGTPPPVGPLRSGQEGLYRNPPLRRCAVGQVRTMECLLAPL